MIDALKCITNTETGTRIYWTYARFVFIIISTKILNSGGKNMNPYPGRAAAI